MNAKNNSIKGLLGAALFSLIAIFIWSIFSFTGTIGFWSAPAFGFLVPLGFYLFSKKQPYSVGGIAACTVVITVSMIIAAYIGYVMNTYAFFLWEGMAFSEITMVEVNDYLRALILATDNGFLYDCLYEIGIGLIGAIICEVIYIFISKKIAKRG